MRLVGSNVGTGKSIVDVVPVPLLALLHFVIAMALLWPLVRVSRLRHVKRDEWFNLFLQALFGTFGFTLPMLGGVQRTSAVAAGGITSTIPVVVALLSWPILKERPNGRALASIAEDRRRGCHQSRSRGSERGRRDIVRAMPPVAS
jgi:drug/metabolite transporter (DMT)-like permease